MTTSIAKIKNLKVGNFKIELDENTRGLPVARYYQLMTMGKNKGHYKLIEGFYFGTEEKRTAWVSEKLKRFHEIMNSKAKEKATKETIRNNFKNPFKVGDIYYSSWGYDQTNIDFYKILEVKEKSIVIAEIGAKVVPGSGYHDSQNVTPDPDNVTGKPEQKNVQFYLNSDGTPRYCVRMRHGGFSEYTAGEKGVYTSWGH